MNPVFFQAFCSKVYFIEKIVLLLFSVRLVSCRVGVGAGAGAGVGVGGGAVVGVGDGVGVYAARKP